MKLKLQFIDSPTEQTTAITDLILAVVAAAIAIYLPFIGQQHPYKALLWSWAFTLLALASFLGAIAHGLKLSETMQKAIWVPLFLALALTVALFMGGIVYDLWGISPAQQAMPTLLIIGLIFFGITLIRPNTFAVFIIYELIAMLFALSGYLWLALSSALPGAWLMVAGILVTIIAAGVQAGRAVTFTFIWQFDHNGAYHLIQVVGLVLLAAGLHGALSA